MTQDPRPTPDDRKPAEPDLLHTSYGPVNLAHCAPVIREEIEMIGDGDPFAMQRDMPRRVALQIAAVDEAAIDWHPARDEWSIREILAHLLQTELAYGFRYRLIAAAPGTRIQGYDQDVWISELPDKWRSVDEMLSELASFKRFNVAYLEGLNEDQRARYGLHSERGPESIAALIGAIAGHDLIHERQIAENVRLWQAAEGKA